MKPIDSDTAHNVIYARSADHPGKKLYPLYKQIERYDFIMMRLSASKAAEEKSSYIQKKRL